MPTLGLLATKGTPIEAGKQGFEPYFFGEFVRLGIMNGSRTVTAVVGIVGSLLLSAVLWWYFDTLLFFLFIPFIPFLFRGSDQDTRGVRECPQCGFRTVDDEYEYCPRDGRRLEQQRR
jgi:hypothetical protein